MRYVCLSFDLLCFLGICLNDDSLLLPLLPPCFCFLLPTTTATCARTSGCRDLRRALMINFSRCLKSTIRAKQLHPFLVALVNEFVTLVGEPTVFLNLMYIMAIKRNMPFWLIGSEAHCKPRSSGSLHSSLKLINVLLSW
jgi:hypothetical protein